MQAKISLLGLSVAGLLACACVKTDHNQTHPPGGAAQVALPNTDNQATIANAASDIAAPANAPMPSAIAANDRRDTSEPDGRWGIVDTPPYSSVVQRVENMVSDSRLQAAAARRGLSVMNVMWEDTGRAQGSALGPNISDLTLQVRFREEPGAYSDAALMPVIRNPNFVDKTADIATSKFLIRVGNEHGSTLHTALLTDVLKNLKRYVSQPWTIKGTGNLLSKRDSHFLVSAQAVFLPIPKRGQAEFNPAVFNYQSAPGSPALLTLLVTRQGTSMSVIENRPQDSSVLGMGQELYFNNAGQRTNLTAERRSDVVQRIAAQGGPITEDDRSALARGADVLFLVQVPLKHLHRGMLGGLVSKPKKASGSPVPSSAAMEMKEEASDVEQAVLGHGEDLGPVLEGNGLTIERDPRFPIRITVQFYKATSNGIVSEKDLDQIARSIGSVYEHADFVGSLVIPNGDPKRPTAWQSVPDEWFPW